MGKQADEGKKMSFHGRNGGFPDADGSEERACGTLGFRGGDYKPVPRRRAGHGSLLNVLPFAQKIDYFTVISWSRTSSLSASKLILQRHPASAPRSIP
jgi:hypothetical protein